MVARMGPRRGPGGVVSGETAGGDAVREGGKAPATRRPRAALRRLLIDAGVDFLIEEGIGTPGDSITFKRVFDHLEETTGVRATHASVIGRIWADQQEFRRDVLVSLADHDSADLTARTGEALDALLETFDLSTPGLRRAALRELVRIGTEFELSANISAPGWRERTAVWAVGTTAGSQADEEIAATLRGARRRMFLGYVDLYQGFLDRLGFRVRDPFTMVEFVRVATSLVEGCNHRALVGVGPSMGVLRPTGPGGALQEWTLLGIGLDALVDTFTEPVPDPALSA